MSSNTGPFPDSKAAVAGLLADLVAVTYTGARTLASIQSGKLPAVRVMRTGGADDRITDVSALSVAVFAKDADSAEGIAEACRQRLAIGSGIPTAAGLIDRAETLSGPQLVTSPDVAVVQCVTASYRISMRR